MVFESLVADLLNKYLGKFVENLDRSQLKIGIWGGDVVLKNLSLKQSALDELDLPIKTVYGHLGKLVLKIPWKNLYSAPVVVDIDQLYLLAVPNLNVKYDEGKEEKWIQDAKRAELSKYEQMKKEKEIQDKPKGNDTFAEKFATMVIHNLQVSIKNIHIRFEENNSVVPFAAGITLHSLSLQTIPSWGEQISVSLENLIFKELLLECLSVYWNPNTNMFYDPANQTGYNNMFENGIATKIFSPADYKYLLGPINSSANLRINCKPEIDGTNFTIPKMLLKFDMETLLVRISKGQFQDMLVLLEALGRMKIQTLYKKYRPNVTTYRGHYKEWWRFAYNCIVETEIRRKRDNWNWEKIAGHRLLVKRYADAYKSRISTNKPSSEVLKTCQSLEESLDTINIILVRERIGMEVARVEVAQAQEQQSGWFGRWWGGSAKADVSPSSPDDIASQFQKAMTPSEKEKFFSAIDYQEGAKPTDYPPHFVFLDLMIELHRLQLAIVNEGLSDPDIMNMSLTEVGCRVYQRPTNSSLSVDVSVSTMSTTGCKQNITKDEYIVPRLVEPKPLISKKVASFPKLPVFKCLIELNPLDEKCDTRVHLKAMPLRIIYDSLTVNSIIDVFTLARKETIQPIQQAASMKLAQLKQKSSLGLQYAIDHHNVIDLQVDIMASHIIIPKNGFYHSEKIQSLILNLGQLEFHSKPRVESLINVRELHQMGRTEEEILSQMMSHSYDNYDLKLSNLQVLFVMDNEDWDLDRGLVDDVMYLLRPTSVIVSLAMCMIHDDPRLPKMKIDGQLPNISISLVDSRALELISFLYGIPLPEEKETVLPPPTDMKGAAVMGSTASLSGGGVIMKSALGQSKNTIPPEEVVQFTEVELNFQLKLFSINMVKAEKKGVYTPLLSFELMVLGMEMVKKTFDLSLTVSLGGLAMQQVYNEGIVKILNTPMADGYSDFLFILKYMNVDKLSPEFHSKYGSTLQFIEVDFTKIDLLFHQEAILTLIALANEITSRVNLIKGSSVIFNESQHSQPYSRVLSVIKEESSMLRKSSDKLHTTSKKLKRVEVVTLKVAAKLKSICLELSNASGAIMRLGVDGGIALITMKKHYTQIEASLMGVSVLNPSYTLYRKIVSIIDEKEALVVNVVLFNEADRSRKADIMVKASMACIRVVFLNDFITSVLDFFNNFQAAQNMIIGATQAAAEKAKHNVKDAYENATRISMDIKIKAPIILVPISSTVSQALLLDLGFINLENNIAELPVPNTSEFPVVDNIHLVLENIKISQISVGENLNTIHERLILKPISFQLTVKRNLSSGWFSGMSDMEITGNLKAVQILFCQMYYETVMRIMQENLGSAKPETGKPSLESKGPIRSMTASDRKLDPLTRKISHGVVMASKNVSTTVKFNFTVDSLEVELFSGNPEVAPGLSSLALFKLIVFSMNGSMLSDSTLSVTVLLFDCLMDDRRISQKNKIHRYMESIDTKESGEKDIPKRMIDITFRQKDSDMFVDCRVRSFNLILNVDHLLKIMSLFELKDESNIDVTSKATYNASKHSLVPKKESSRASVSVQVLPDDEKDIDRTISLNLRVEQPSIFLVESMDDINTNALILQADILCKFKTIGYKKMINGVINNVELWSCCYNPLKRLKTKASVIRPVSIYIQGSTPKSGLHIDISTSNIRLSVSADIIQLLSNIYSAITPKSSVEVQDLMTDYNYKQLWDVQDFEESEYLFLATEIGEEISESSDVGSVSTMEVVSTLQSEICIFSIPSIVITLEAGSGTTKIPVFLLESSLHANIKDWSSQLYVDTQMTVKLSYFNETLALWEPLLEPVEVVKHQQFSFVPWELSVQVETVLPDYKDSSTVPVESVKHKPKMSIYISSKETLSLTVTKSCLDIISTLSSSFTDAIYKPTEKLHHDLAPYILKNDTGLQILVQLEISDFQLYYPPGKDLAESPSTLNSQIKEVLLEPGAKVDLTSDDVASSPIESTMDTNIQERYISMKILKYDLELEIPAMRADKRFFILNQERASPRNTGGDIVGLVSHVKIENGTAVITLRSIIQIENLLSVTVNVYYMLDKGNEVKLIGSIEPLQTLNLPLNAVHTPSGELFFSVHDYTVSVQPFVWKELQKSHETTMLLQCNPRNSEDSEPFFIKAVGEMEQIYFGLTSRFTMASNCYNIYLRPAYILKNLLPVDIIICVQGVSAEKRVSPGGSMQVLTAEPGHSTIITKISNYLDRDWTCKKELPAFPMEFSVWTFDSYDGHKLSMDLGVHTVVKGGTFVVSLYCPFWMINSTSLNIAYRQADDSSNVVYHPKDLNKPVLFSFHSKSFFAKKKSCIRVEDGIWSEKFSLDVAGSSGVVSCKLRQSVYQIGVHIRLLNNALTKQITFTPLFIFINHCKVHMQLKEYHEEGSHQFSWLEVEAGNCLPFWPTHEQGSLILRITDTTESTIPFRYDQSHNSVLRLNNKYGAVNIDVQIGDGKIHIAIYPYEYGMAPALLINHTHDVITFDDRFATGNPVFKLKPMQRTYFTWGANEINNILVWCDGKTCHTLREDGIGEFPLSNMTGYWVSFLYGFQRVLLLTADPIIAQQAQNISDFDVISTKINIAIHGIGLSLIDNRLSQEIVYLGVNSSGVIWETKKTSKKRFKAMSVQDSVKIEQVYSAYMAQIHAGDNPDPLVNVDSRIQVNFESMELLKPSAKLLHRRYNTGLWINLNLSPRQLQIHLQINRVQIDNQVYDCVFPVVLSPAPLPKSIAVDNVPKPFIEVSIVKRLNSYSGVQQYKYFKVLVQEFHVKVDVGFISSLVKLFESKEMSEEDQINYFNREMTQATDPLMMQVALSSSVDQKNFYDILHLSPLKIHLSFSLSGSGSHSSAESSRIPDFVSTFAQSFGVTVTDVQDVVLKLAYFERQYTFISNKQLLSQVQSHYLSQMLKQIYVLVLGLDVMGNPFGLFRGFTQGATDLFYEPFQGAIQGPGEFAEGLMLGVRSLFGHTVGGAAGAFSKITGAMGKGIAALTFDKDYQRQRREAMQNRPQNVQEGLAQSGKGLVMGVVEGVGGVITKPISGAKEEGIQGFFKGVGKGVVGLVTRPTAGVIDFASGSFSAVKRVTDITEECTRIRSPRYIESDGLVKPYSRLKAEGHKLLVDLDKGKYLATDLYVFHMPIGLGKHKDMLLVTDQRLFYLNHNELFGGYQVDWSHTWSEFLEPPKLDEKGVALSIADKRKGLKFFSGSSGNKILLIEDGVISKFLVSKITQLMEKSLCQPSTATLGRRSLVYGKFN